MDKLCTYHAMNPGVAHLLDDTMKLIMLQNAMSDISEFTAVKNSSDQELARGNAAFTCDQHTMLLLSVCGMHDKKHHPVMNNTAMTSFQDSGSHQVNEMSIESLFFCKEDFYNDTPSRQVFNIDTNPLELEIMEAQRRAAGTSLKYGQWKKMTPEDQKIWYSLSDDAKRTILTVMKNQFE